MTAYNNNYLKQVIFQINFVPLPALNLNIEEKLSDLCRTKTGAQEVVKMDNVNIVLGIIGQEAKSEKKPIWTFRGSELQVSVQDNALQIISTKYTNHTDFHSLIKEITTLFSEKYKPTIQRIAMRYVNIIAFNKGGAFDFDGYINSTLLSPTNDYVNLGLVRSIGNMLLKDDTNDLFLNFVYGYPNSQFPNKIAKREFLLDYDCFKNTNDPNLSIPNTIENIRNFVNSIFEKSIESKLRIELNS